MKTKIVVLGTMVLILLSQITHAQTSLTVPGNTKNTRFYEDVFDIERPALSIAGFTNNGDHSKGYGLKQILEKLYNNSGDPLMVKSYNEIVRLANEDLIDPFNVPNQSPLTVVNNNSNKLQARAFVALARYVLYKNGIINQIPGATQTAPPHDVALSDLRSAFLSPTNYLLADGDHTDDLVHRVRSTSNYARALDLYLALENAYDYWNESDYDLENSVKLLTKSQKEFKIWDLGFKLYLVNWKMVTGVGQISQENAEPGNRPMKIFLSNGYSALALQDLDFTDVNDNDTNFDIYGPLFLASALGKMELPSSPDRGKYWAYQSGYGVSNHSGAWAEGAYYFEFALFDVIPFWHAVRLNDLLDYASYNFSDPFNSSWFTSPLNWLVDISTPEGGTPPLDDGKRRKIRYSHLLNWSSVYGDAEIGKKYKWVQNQVGLNGSEKHTLLVSLAIPKISDNTNEIIPAELYGNHGNITSKDQVIVRKKDSNNRTHYLLVNGEHGASITHGEGHEQPDQLQLLYHVDDQPFLMDAGYDEGSVTSNSAWNGYHHHNTMSLDYEKTETSSIGNFVTYENLGGLESPYVDLDEFHKVADHHEVNFLKYTELGNIIKISGEVDLEGGGNESTYNRDVLFIDDVDFPYIVDINSINKISGSEKLFKFRYHLPSGPHNFGYNSNWATIQTSNLKLHHWTRPIEEYQTSYDNLQIEIEESTGTTSANRLEIKTAPIFNYPSIVALPNFNVVSIIAVSPSNITSIPQEIFSSASYRGWFWQPTPDVIDVIVKKSKIDNQAYNSTLSFDINDQSEFIVPLKLNGGLDYGFARLKKQNGLWKIDNNYKINITQPGYYYTSNHTVGNYSYPANSILYVGDGVTLTFSGTVTLDDAEVYLGKYAKIEVTSSGKLEADNTQFKRLNPGDMHSGVQLWSDGNQITNCSVTGGKYGVNMAISNGNIITNSNFSNNQYGLNVNYYSDVRVQGGSISGNSKDGIRVYRGDLNIGWPAGSNSNERTDIKNNGGHGITMYNYANVWIKEANIETNYSHEVRLDNTSRAYMAGHIDIPTTYTGDNKFKRNESKYIYNLAMTGSGETYTGWEVKANYNYWGDGSAPVSSEFHGPVEADYYLIDDPSAPSSQSKINSDPSNMEADAAPFQVLSAAQGQQAVADASDAEEEQRTLHVKQELMRLQRWMNDKPENPENGRWLRAYYSLLHFASKEGFAAERREMRSRTNHWLARYHVLNSLSADSLREMEQQASIALANAAANSRKPEGRAQYNGRNIAKASNLVGEVAVLLEIEEALRRRQFDRVLSLYDKYGPAITNADHQYGLLSALSLAYQGKGEYGSALGTLEQIEQLKPDKVMAEGYEAPDFTDIKAMLADSAKAHSQKKEFLKGKPGKKLSGEDDLPAEFKLGNAYPNPFNPTTTIGFELPETEKVRIEVFDVSGKLVSVLTNQIWQSGRHQLTFNADGLASGVYLVRAQYGSLTETRKITLVK